MEGHRVFVEGRIGNGSDFANEEFQKVGSEVIGDRKKSLTRQSLFSR